MNHSKYNPKYDPKHSSYQPQAAAPVMQVPAAVTPAVTTSHAEVIAEPNRLDAKSDSQDAPVAMKAAAPKTGKDNDALISDGSETGEKTPGISAKSIS